MCRWGMMNRRKTMGRVREEEVRMARERARKGEEKIIGARGGAHQSSSSWHRPSSVVVAITTNDAAVVVVIVVQRRRQRQQHHVVDVVVVVVEAQGIMGTVYGVKTKIRLMSLQNNLFLWIVVNVSVQIPPPQS